MSSEVCPFCGRTYKRLKSHLPHCKAAPSPAKPPEQQDVSANPTTNPQLSKTKTKKILKSSVEEESDGRRFQLSSENPAAKRKLAKPQSTIPKPKKKSLRDVIEAAKLELSTSADSTTKPDWDSSKYAQKKKVSKKVLQSEHKAEGLDTKEEENNQKNLKRRNFWEEQEDLSVNEPVSELRGGEQGRIHLHGVKATLGCEPSNGSSIISQIDTANVLEGKAATGGGGVSPSGMEKTTNRAPSFQPAKSPPPAPPLFPPPSTGGQRHVTGTFTKSPPLSQLASPRRFPGVLQTLPVGVELGVRQGPPEGSLSQRRLAQVTLRELPNWLVSKTPSHPREVVDVMQRGWQWYYRKYIDVRKGGVAGIGMLLAGYCVLSYVWSYPHTKRDRWRKHH